MLRMPVPLWAASQEHLDELLREFTLMTAGLQDEDSQAPPVPVRLIRLVADLTARFAGTGDVQRAQLFEAAAAGEPELDLVYHMPPAAGPASADLGRLLDEADDYCRAGEHLLTLASPEDIVRFRRWYLGQVQEQLAGAEPVPWPAWAAGAEQTAGRAAG